MPNGKRFLVFTSYFFFLPQLIGCKDRFDEGFSAGYAAGVSDTTTRLKLEHEQKMLELDRQRASTNAVTSVQTCGGAGVNLNGRYYEGGKTGCVRVYSDGRVVRY